MLADGAMSTGVMSEPSAFFGLSCGLSGSEKVRK